MAPGDVSQFHRQPHCPLTTDAGVESSDPARLGVAAGNGMERQAADHALDCRSGFENLANAAPVLLWVSNPDGEWTWVNQPWLDFTGLTIDGTLRDGWLRSVHPDDHSHASNAYRQAGRERHAFTAEFRLLRRDGEYRWVQSSGNPRWTDDGAYAGHVGTSHDITDRKDAEEAQRILATSSAELGSSLDYNTTLKHLASFLVPELADFCIIHIMDGEGKLGRTAMSHADPRHTDLLHELERRFPMTYNEDTPVARAVEQRRTQLVADISPALLRQAARDDEHLGLLEGLNCRSMLVAPLVARGRSLGAITLVGTEGRPRYGPREAALAEALAARAAIAVDNARLFSAAEAARQEAEAANRAKDDFLATLSHELRTPLNAIQGWNYMLRTGQLNAEQTTQALDSVERSTRSQMQLVEDLLDVSRIVAGKMKLQLRAMSLEPIIEAACEAVRPAAEAKHISLERVRQPAASQVMVDAQRIQQVLLNLLTNAIKFTAEGGRVEVRLSETDGTVCLEVCDTGQGIAADFLPYVFERFRQADSSETRSHGGLGIGLSLVRHLVDMHHGQVKAHSEGQDQGATFEVCLPGIEPESKNPDTKSPPPTSPIQSAPSAQGQKPPLAARTPRSRHRPTLATAA